MQIYVKVPSTIKMCAKFPTNILKKARNLSFGMKCHLSHYFLGLYTLPSFSRIPFGPLKKLSSHSCNIFEERKTDLKQVSKNTKQKSEVLPFELMI